MSIMLDFILLCRVIRKWVCKNGSFLNLIGMQTGVAGTQIVGLGLSPISQKYAIKDLAEARAYLENDVLRAHLLELCDALLSLETNDADEVMGFPDNLKLRSCMTLFAEADPGCAQFHAVLDKYFGGKKDRSTLEILQPPRQNCREIEDWS